MFKSKKYFDRVREFPAQRPGSVFPMVLYPEGSLPDKVIEHEDTLPTAKITYIGSAFLIAASAAIAMTEETYSEEAYYLLGASVLMGGVTSGYAKMMTSMSKKPPIQQVIYIQEPHLVVDLRPYKNTQSRFDLETVSFEIREVVSGQHYQDILIVKDSVHEMRLGEFLSAHELPEISRVIRQELQDRRDSQRIKNAPSP